MSRVRRRVVQDESDEEELLYADPDFEPLAFTGRKAQLGKFDDPNIKADIEQYNPPRPELTGSRINSKGEEVKADMAIKALSSFYRGEPLPIFQYDEGLSLDNYLPEMLNNPRYISRDADGNTYITKGIAPTDEKPKLNANIRSGYEHNNHIVFAITSSVHAILCILSQDGILYTVGFGYDSDPQQTKLLNVLRENKTIGERVAHALEELTGALYTADYLLPSINQACKIAWVSYLTKSICDELENYLAQTTSIIYSLKQQGGKYIVTNKCTLTVNQTYSEASGVINRNSTNCIRWLKNILGVKLNCGILVDDPGSCMGVERDEWEALANALERSDNYLVEETIRTIQQRLQPSLCEKGYKMIKGVCKYVGLSSGGRKTRKIGNKRKNKRKNKSRAHKKSRTYKRK